jgi:hypothetical protein
MPTCASPGRLRKEIISPSGNGLREGTAVGAEYERLKLDPAARHDGTTLESQEAYSLAKTRFVVSVLERAIRHGLPRTAPSDS